MEILDCLCRNGGRIGISIWRLLLLVASNYAEVHHLRSPTTSITSLTLGIDLDSWLMQPAASSPVPRPEAVPPRWGAGEALVGAVLHSTLCSLFPVARQFQSISFPMSGECCRFSPDTSRYAISQLPRCHPADCSCMQWIEKYPIGASLDSLGPHSLRWELPL